MYKVKLTEQAVVITDPEGNLYSIADFGGKYILEDARYKVDSERLSLEGPVNAIN